MLQHKQQYVTQNPEEVNTTDSDHSGCVRWGEGVGYERLEGMLA
jgi:hypothetical protein